MVTLRTHEHLQTNWIMFSSEFLPNAIARAHRDCNGDTHNKAHGGSETRFRREHRSTRNSGRLSSVASTRPWSPTAHRCGGCVAQRCTAASIDGLGGQRCELGELLAVHLLGGQRSFHSHLAVFTP